MEELQEEDFQRQISIDSLMEHIVIKTIKSISKDD
jgi:hypothetical protein